MKLALAETTERNAIFEIRQLLSTPRGITGIGDLLEKPDKILDWTSMAHHMGSCRLAFARQYIYSISVFTNSLKGVWTGIKRVHYKSRNKY